MKLTPRDEFSTAKISEYHPLTSKIPRKRIKHEIHSSDANK